MCLRDFALAAPGVAGEEWGAVHDDRDARSALLRRHGPGEHVQKEEGLSVTDPREPGTEAPRRPAVVFRLDGGLVALPVLAVGRIGDQVVEMAAGVVIVGERAAEGDGPRVAPGWVLHEEVRLREGPRLGVHLLTEKVDLRLRIDRGPEQLPILLPAFQDVLLGDHQQAARSAARVVDAANRASSDPFLVPRKHQIHHEMDHVPGCEVFTGVFVEGLVEPADQLLEDRPHRRVVHDVRMEIDLAEALQYLEEQGRPRRAC